jgi:uncharacterized membrane protein YtjA (UPF0391 family)
MLIRVALLLLVVALLAGLFGFGAIASTYAEEAKMVFFLCFALAALSFVACAFRKRSFRD